MEFAKYTGQRLTGCKTGYSTPIKDVRYSKAQKMLKFTFNALTQQLKHCPTMFYTATVRSTRSGPSILYDTSLRPSGGLNQPITDPWVCDGLIQMLIAMKQHCWWGWCYALQTPSGGLNPAILHFLDIPPHTLNSVDIPETIAWIDQKKSHRQNLMPLWSARSYRFQAGKAMCFVFIGHNK